MGDGEKNELTCELSNAKEYINILYGMLSSEQRRVGQELELITAAKKSIDDALFELTGDEFYRNKEEKNES